MKCEKCGCDPRPFVNEHVQMRPCGLIKTAHFICDIKISGCPMTEWQDGYAACLEDRMKKVQRPTAAAEERRK